ncbi:MAG: hypothetical protein ACREN8_13440, partial [Candidatus Dormibacteraceae bacterium]
AGPLVGPMALSSPGYRLGFPQYLAPEQVNGQLGDERTDVYAVATLVFELLTETPLFDGSNPGEVLRAVKLTPPPSAHSRNAALPPAVDRVLSQALAKDPLSRPRSVSELLDQLMNLPEPASTGTNSAAMSIDTAAAVLNRMGVPQINFNGTPVLNSYLSFLLRQARLVAAEHWSDVLTAAGLQHYCEQLPPDDGERVVGAETVGALADGFSRVFGADSQEYLRQLGIKSTQEWMEATQRRPFRMMGRSSTQVADVLMLFTSSMDRVRGESLHLWKPIDDQQFWIIHYANLGVFGRSQPTSPCTFWLGTYQAALEWGGLAGKWTVAEEECGAATGSGNCVFKLSQI